MIELEPVADVRVFVPTSGDIVIRACGADQGFVSGDAAAGLAELRQIPTPCCNAGRVGRPVP